MSESFLNGRVVLHAGDSRDVLKTIADNSIDSIVTDPPYALVSIVKRFGGKDAAAVKVPEGGSGAYARASSGFMGKQWDTGETAFAVEFWAECLRVLKPGGHVVAFSGTRTYHRMACAIEDAGFEVRDMLSWLYGSGFPKSQNVSAFIDKMAGAERPVIGYDAAKAAQQTAKQGTNSFGDYAGNSGAITAPVTPAAIEFDGFGTALKPAFEPIVLARKPLSEPTVAANVLRWRTGALNIGACRVNSGPVEKHTRTATVTGANSMSGTSTGSTGSGEFVEGRWPANVVTDGSDEVVAMFPNTKSGKIEPHHVRTVETTTEVFGKYGKPSTVSHGDQGSAARFFYTAKADADDRLGSKHPTVKPVDLMQWLCRLVTPKGGTVLDPFAGTGTTGEAAFREGFKAVLIEREPEYQADIRRRMALCMSGPDERARESIKAKTKDQPVDHGPLFAGAAE